MAEQNSVVSKLMWCVGLGALAVTGYYVVAPLLASLALALDKFGK